MGPRVTSVLAEAKRDAHSARYLQVCVDRSATDVAHAILYMRRRHIRNRTTADPHGQHRGGKSTREPHACAVGVSTYVSTSRGISGPQVTACRVPAGALRQDSPATCTSLQLASDQRPRAKGFTRAHHKATLTRLIPSLPVYHLYWHGTDWLLWRQHLTLRATCHSTRRVSQPTRGPDSQCICFGCIHCGPSWDC